MELPRAHLQHAARYESETRLIRCSDGLVRHITLSQWHWDKIKFMEKYMPESSRLFPGFCSFVAKEFMAESDIDYENAFRKAMKVNLFIYYHRFVGWRDNIANDF